MFFLYAQKASWRCVYKAPLRFTAPPGRTRESAVLLGVSICLCLFWVACGPKKGATRDSSPAGAEVGNNETAKGPPKRPPAVRRKPALTILYIYRHPTLRLEARVLLQSSGDRGCAARHLIKRFPQREVSETKRFCFSVKKWKSLKEDVRLALSSKLQKSYACKRESEKRPTISLTVSTPKRKVAVTAICGEDGAEIPKGLERLIDTIKEMTLPPL